MRTLAVVHQVYSTEKPTKKDVRKIEQKFLRKQYKKQIFRHRERDKTTGRLVLPYLRQLEY